MKRLIGIDYGDKNIGIAISDPFVNIAMPYSTIIRKNELTIKPYIKKIGEILKEYEIGTIILGFPKNMDNSIGVRAEITMEFKERLIRNFKRIPVVLWDERLTTVMAQNFLNETNISKKNQKPVIDQISACFILQNYIDFLKRDSNE
ncbi:MAG: Holliday junction resolvase RuvX [Defluviitaleaceae bacterium]|nr:Holliday junction resolvase RuvX [Defluviitaleaceae bacterium]